MVCLMNLVVFCFMCYFGIDWLCGLVIVLVVLYYIGLCMLLCDIVLGEWLLLWLLNVLNYNGYEVVFVFFVISGFLIVGNVLDCWGDLLCIDLGMFYWCCVVCILLCLLVLVGVLVLLYVLVVLDYVIDCLG